MAHQEINLEVQPRTTTGKQSAQLRRQGLIPAAIYGHNKQTVNVQLTQLAFEQAYKKAGKHGLINLSVGNVTGASRTATLHTEKAFIHQIQRDPMKGGIIHVDFHAVNMDEPMITSVPLVLVGESPAVANKLGILLQSLSEVEIKCLPADVPDHFEIDVSGLAEVDAAVHISDLITPSKVEILTPADEMIAKISMIKEEVEEEPVATEETETETASAEGSKDKDKDKDA